MGVKLKLIEEQIIIIEAFSDQGPKYESDVLRLIKKYKVGGLIYFQGGPVRQATAR